MVKGLQIFRDHFRQFQGSFVLIGGAACTEWFTAAGLPFRATKDLDIVLVMDAIDQTFIDAMRRFIAEGNYEIREKPEGTPILYRFAKPSNGSFPFMLELFCPRHERLDLVSDQTSIPVEIEPGRHSLSAMLMDDVYYHLLKEHYDLRDGLPFANATALIPMKAYAYLNLSRSRDAGEPVDSRDIDKHRADVFRLTGTISGEPGPELPSKIIGDLTAFVRAFPPESVEWPGILASIANTLGKGIRPESLIQALRTYFRLPV